MARQRRATTTPPPTSSPRTTGNQTIHVDQRVNGGQWRTLGTFALAAGDANQVGVSRWTSAPGYVIADAVRLTRV